MSIQEAQAAEQGCCLKSANAILLDGSCWRKRWFKSCAKEGNFISTSQILMQVALCRAASNGDETLI